MLIDKICVLNFSRSLIWRFIDAIESAASGQANTVSHYSLAGNKKRENGLQWKHRTKREEYRNGVTLQREHAGYSRIFLYYETNCRVLEYIIVWSALCYRYQQEGQGCVANSGPRTVINEPAYRSVINIELVYHSTADALCALHACWRCHCDGHFF